MTIQPVTYNLTIHQGATFRQNFIWQNEDQEPIDLTGYTARMMARVNVADAIAFIDLSTENGGITLGGAAGSIALFMSATATSAITANVGCYDLELTAPSGDVTRLVQGPLTISKEITR